LIALALKALRKQSPGYAIEGVDLLHLKWQFP